MSRVYPPKETQDEILEAIFRLSELIDTLRNDRAYLLGFINDPEHVPVPLGSSVVYAAEEVTFKPYTTVFRLTGVRTTVAHNRLEHFVSIENEHHKEKEVPWRYLEKYTGRVPRYKPPKEEKGRG